MSLPAPLAIERKESTENKPRLLISRITALWALSESALGGFLHAVKVPFKGMIISNVAVFLIGLLAYFRKKSELIVKETVIVLILKALISPHSPPTAYAAVFLQGGIGELLFIGKKFFQLRIYVFSIIVSIITGLQRFLVLTLIFGEALWSSINQLFRYALKALFIEESSVDINFSFWIIFIYVFIHILGGFITAWYTNKTLKTLTDHNNQKLFLPVKTDQTENLSNRYKRKKKIPLVILILIAAIGVVIWTITMPESNRFDVGELLFMIIRAITIMLFWFYILSPLINNLLQKYLSKKRKIYSENLNRINEMLPNLKLIVLNLWKQSSHIKGLKRVDYLIKSLLFQILFTNDA